MNDMRKLMEAIEQINEASDFDSEAHRDIDLDEFEIFYAGFDYGYHAVTSPSAGDVTEAEAAYHQWKKTGNLS